MTAVLLTVEHASPEVPPGVELGVPESVRLGHRGWDPGALALAEALSAATGARLQAGRWTRLFVDLNRRETHPGVVPLTSFGVAVPGNAALSAADRTARVARWHTPWRARFRQTLDATLARHDRVLHLSVHSFDPGIDPPARDFDLGVLFDPERPAEAAWADRLLAAIAAAGLRGRANAPYLGTNEGHTKQLREDLPDPRYAGIELELSQGASAEARARAAAALGSAL